MWIGILLSVFQQFVGINVIFYYSTTLWKSVGFDESSALLTSVITSVTNILVTIVAILLVDRVGRRKILLAGSALMGLSLATMALSFSFAELVTAADGTQSAELGAPWSIIALVAANLFVVGFGATWGPLVWVLLGEMFPNRIRAAALAVAAAAQWVANFAISTTFPVFADISLTFAYGFYAFFAVLSFFFVWGRSGDEGDRTRGHDRGRRPCPPRARRLSPVPLRQGCPLPQGCRPSGALPLSGGVVAGPRRGGAGRGLVRALGCRARLAGCRVHAAGRLVRIAGRLVRILPVPALR